MLHKINKPCGKFWKKQTPLATFVVWLYVGLDTGWGLHDNKNPSHTVYVCNSDIVLFCRQWEAAERFPGRQPTHAEFSIPLQRIQMTWERFSCTVVSGFLMWPLPALIIHQSPLVNTSLVSNERFHLYSTCSIFHCDPLVYEVIRIDSFSASKCSQSGLKPCLW